MAMSGCAAIAINFHSVRPARKVNGDRPRAPHFPACRRTEKAPADPDLCSIERSCFGPMRRAWARPRRTPSRPRKIRARPSRLPIALLGWRLEPGEPDRPRAKADLKIREAVCREPHGRGFARKPDRNRESKQGANRNKLQKISARRVAAYHRDTRDRCSGTAGWRVRPG